MRPTMVKKKPIIVEAFRYDGYSGEAIEKWSGGNVVEEKLDGVKSFLVLDTLEGRLIAELGDWIIKGVNGEFYPVRSDVFYKTYDVVGTTDIDF